MNAPEQPIPSTKPTVARNAIFSCGAVSICLNPLDAVVIIGAAKAANAMLHESHERRTEPQGGGGVGSNFSRRTLGFKQKIMQRPHDSLAAEIWVRVLDVIVSASN